MRKYYFILMTFGLLACNPKLKSIESNKIGSFNGLFTHGNFSDEISFEVERDSTNWNVFFTSLEQNANRIPFQDVKVRGDSISFKLQSDFYTYTFNNMWTENYTKLEGSLMVDTITTRFTLDKELSDHQNTAKSEEVSFESNGLNLNGTIWYPEITSNKGLVIVTSSGNADRSASSAESMLFAQRGYTTFHYDKRGTGSSQGDWTSATIKELAMDDINAIKYFSSKTGIPLSAIGIKGSSQGGTKIPYILNELEDLGFGVVVSCPGVNLLESDLNYWKNRNSEAIGQDIGEAQALQRKVFKHIAGKLSRPDLEKAISIEKSKPWFANVWIPNLDEVKIDKKLLFSPIPYFEMAKQPLLIIQGTLDEIIPANSHEIISNVLVKAKNDRYETILLEGASHSMHNVGKSDFPYWSKLHPNYLKTIEEWVNTVSNKK